MSIASCKDHRGGPRHLQTGKHGGAHSAHQREAVGLAGAGDMAVFKNSRRPWRPIEHWTTVQSVEYAMRYNVVPFMGVSSIPVLMVTSAYDDITMTSSVPAFQKIPCPRKRLVQIGGDASHMSLYDNPNHLDLVGRECAEFAKQYL